MQVIVTQAQERVEQIRSTLASEHFDVQGVPAIEIIVSDEAKLEIAIASQSVAAAAWLVFTSPNGVRNFAANAANDDWKTALIAVVGTQTGKTVEEVGGKVALWPGQQDADGLVNAFPWFVDGAQTVMVIRPEETREIVEPGLRAKGWQAVAVVAYRTVARTLTDQEHKQVAGADLLVVTSPSSLRSLTEQIKPLPPLVAIGRATAAAMTVSGHAAVATAAAPDHDGLVAAIRRAAKSS